MSSTNAVSVLRRIGSRLQEVPPALGGQEIIALLEAGMGYENVALLIPGAKGDLEPVALSLQPGDADSLATDKRHVTDRCLGGGGITGWVAKFGRSVRLGDVRRDDRYLEVRSDIRSELCVPILRHCRVAGVLNIETRRPHAYTAHDKEVMEAAAAQIALAMRAWQEPVLSAKPAETETIGCLTSCMYCHKLRDDESGDWLDPDTYLRLNRMISHGVCPCCIGRWQSDFGLH